MDLECDASGGAWSTGPERPLATAAEVHVWRLGLDAGGRPGPEGLPAAERARAERMLRPGPAARWAAARWGLRIVLGRYLAEEPATIEVDLGQHGKPQLTEGPRRLTFNLSHSGALGLVAVTVGWEVGVDVERIEPRRDLAAVARRELGPAEAAAVTAASGDRRAQIFYAAWTRHEARLKCLGVGLDGPRKERPVTVLTLDPGPGYAGAVATTGGHDPRLRLWAFDWD